MHLPQWWRPAASTRAPSSLSGSLNKNVQEFYRLHSEELDVAEPGRVDTKAIKRLVVETTSPERLGEFERGAGLEGRGRRLRPPRRGAAGLGARGNVVRSNDGALTTTMVSILAEREVEVSPLEATVFASASTKTPARSRIRRHPPRRRGGRLVSSPRRQPGDGRAVPALPLGEGERALLDALLNALETHRALRQVRGACRGRVVAQYVDGISNLAHKLVDLTDCRALVCLVEMDERVFCVVRTRVAELDAAAVAGARGRGSRAGCIGDSPRSDRRGEDRSGGAAVGGARGRHRARDHVAAGALRLTDDSVAHAMVLCQRHQPGGILVGEDGALAGMVTRGDPTKNRP